MRKASDDLEAAIEAYRVSWRAENPGGTDGTLTEWMVITAEVKVNLEDSDQDRYAFSTLMKGGSLPWHHAKGLLAAANQFLDGNTEDDE